MASKFGFGNIHVGKRTNRILVEVSHGICHHLGRGCLRRTDFGVDLCFFWLVGNGRCIARSVISTCAEQDLDKGPEVGRDFAFRKECFSYGTAHSLLLCETALNLVMQEVLVPAPNSISLRLKSADDNTASGERESPIRRILPMRVVRLSPSLLAAPVGPPMTLYKSLN
jgi:hypothetical protein